MQGTIGAALLAGAALVAQSQPPATSIQPVSKSLGRIVYPQKQSASQQSVDEQECYNWAKAQTGIDPQAPAAQSERDATFRNAVGTCLQGRGYTTD